jgi:hypothetical protein
MIYSKKKVLKMIDDHVETVKNVMECQKRMSENLGTTHDAGTELSIEYLRGQLAALDRLRREIEPFKQIES